MAMSGGGGMGGGDMSAAYQAWKDRMGGASSFFGNLFNDSRRPWADAQRAYDPWMSKAEGAYNPFYQEGVKGMGKYEDWLNGMQDPSGFINNLMGQYKESPWAKYQQDYANRAGINAGSASGMVGSTPWAQQMQQNAEGISSQDMQNWLNQVLGVNTQYGQGWGGIMGQGFNAAQGLGGLYGQQAQDEAKLAYNKEQAGQSRSGGLIGGLFSMFG